MCGLSNGTNVSDLKIMTLKVIRRLQAFSSAIRRTFVQHFTRFQLTACSRGPSAIAGLLVFSTVRHTISVCNKPPSSTQPPTLSMKGNVYWLKCDDDLSLGSKGINVGIELSCLRCRGIFPYKVWKFHPFILHRNPVTVLPFTLS